MYTDDVPNLDIHFSSSSLSLSGSTFERPTTLLKKNESLVSITSSSKPSSERSNISLTPPSRKEARGSHLNTAKKLFLGLLIVVVIALSWVGSTQTAKSSFAGTKFKAPFFMMWFGTGWMMLVFPLSSVLFFVLNRDKWNWAGVRELWR